MLGRMTSSFNRKTQLARYKCSCWNNFPGGLPTKGCYLPLINITMFIGWFQCIRIRRWGGRKIKTPKPTAWHQICCVQSGAFQAMPRLCCSCYKGEAIHPRNSAISPICDPNLQNGHNYFRSSQPMVAGIAVIIYFSLVREHFTTYKINIYLL